MNIGVFLRIDSRESTSRLALRIAGPPKLALVRRLGDPIALESRPPATGLRKPQSPKVLGRVPGKTSNAGGTAGRSTVALLFQRKRPPSTAPGSPRFFLGTLPSTFGDFGSLRPVAGGLDSNPSLCPPKKYRNYQVLDSLGLARF